MATTPPLAVNTPLEKYAKHHKGVFNSLRQTIKKEASMFLFGPPKDASLRLVMKLYHENIIRNLSNKSHNKPPSSKLSCMFGILEDENENLYVTISESPGQESIGNVTTDTDYLAKRAMIINLLQSANVEVEYPESAHPKHIAAPVLLEENLWRKGEAGGVSDSIADHVKIREAINANAELKDSMFFYDQTKAETPNKDDVNLYQPEIRQNSCIVDEVDTKKCKVKWVDSVEYLEKRAAHDPTFPPFKKYNWKKGKTDWKAECNNGHLCTESKLFAYVKIQNDKPDTTKIVPATFMAYWIQAGLPPHNHIIRNYCYRTNVAEGEDPREVAEETESLRKLGEQIKGIYRGSATLRALPNYDEVLMRMIQPVAVACPGCFANVQAYKNGKMSPWDNSNCYVSRTHNSTIGGGKSRKRRSSKKSRKTRRRKSRSTSR